MKNIITGLLVFLVTLTSHIAQAAPQYVVLDSKVVYTGIGGYDKTKAGEVIRTPLESITYSANSPLYLTQSFKVHAASSGYYYGGYWMGLGIALGNNIKPYVEASYDIGSLIWSGVTGQTLDATDRYVSYGIRLEGESVGLAFYRRYYHFNNSFVSLKTGMLGDYTFTGFTVYFRTQ